MTDRVLSLLPLDGETIPGRPAARPAGARGLRERVWERLEWTAAKLAAAAEVEMQALPALLAELTSLPGESRQAALEREERFWTLALAQELSRAAYGLLPAEPKESLALAEQARGVLLRLPAGRYPEAMLHELSAEVWQGLAEAHRHLGDLPAAGRALRQAERFVAGEGLGPHLRAAFCHTLGRLRWDEGRPEEALAALERSARLWQSLEDFSAEAEVLTEAGWITLAVGDLEEAREQLDLATRLARPERSPGTALRAYQGLALAYSGLGRRPEAEAVLAAAREQSPRFQEVPRLELLWDQLDRELCQRRSLLAAAACESGVPVPEIAALDSELPALPAPGSLEAESWEASLPGWPDPAVPENLEVTVEQAGCLPLPLLVSRLLLLLPGDAVVLEPGPASLRLEPCREWMRSLSALPAGQRAQALAELREDVLTFVTPEGALPLPSEILPLSPGETVVLQLQERGGSYRLYAFKDEPAGAGGGPPEEVS